MGRSAIVTTLLLIVCSSASFAEPATHCSQGDVKASFGIYLAQEPSKDPSDKTSLFNKKFRKDASEDDEPIVSKTPTITKADVFEIKAVKDKFTGEGTEPDVLSIKLTEAGAGKIEDVTGNGEKLFVIQTGGKILTKIRIRTKIKTGMMKLYPGKSTPPSKLIKQICR